MKTLKQELMPPMWPGLRKRTLSQSLKRPPVAATSRPQFKKSDGKKGGQRGVKYFCKTCKREHEARNCPAFGVTCLKCGCLNPADPNQPSTSRGTIDFLDGRENLQIKPQVKHSYKKSELVLDGWVGQKRQDDELLRTVLRR